jgi:hypothetical protein
MEQFDLNIEHRGVTKTFHGTFDKYGWSYRFTVDVDGTEVIYEPDEERNLRAIVPSAKQGDSKIKEWVELIGRELEGLLK